MKIQSIKPFNTSSSQAFKAELKFQNAEKFLTPEEIEGYTKRASRWGTPEDKVTINISTQHLPEEENDGPYQHFDVTVLKDGKKTKSEHTYYHWHTSADDTTKLGLNKIFINLNDKTFRNLKKDYDPYKR